MSIVVDRFRPATTQAKQVVVPSGFVLYKSAGGGFQFARPRTWVNVGETPTSILYCSPGKPPLVGVRKWTPLTSDLSAALLQEEQKAKLKDFKRITSDSVPGQQAAALEYTFTDKKMGPLHGLDRVIVTPTGTFLVQWRTLPKEWTQHLPYLGIVTRSVSATK
jgi:hypothetical protein